MYFNAKYLGYAFICICMAYFVIFNKKQSEFKEIRLKDEFLKSSVLKGLTNIDNFNISSINNINCGYIAIGYNSNLDLIVKATDLFQQLNLTGSGFKKNHATLSSLEEFEQTFSHYINTGSAAERYVSDSQTFDKITEAAFQLDSKELYIGGNAAIMASRFSLEGCKVLLGGKIGQKLKDLLPKDIQLTNNEDIKNIKDEIHLILEYSTGTKWHTSVAPRANRFIVAHDETNSKIEPLENFHNSLENFKADKIVIAGTHLLEGNEENFREKRLQDLQNKFDLISKNIPIHLELASIGNLTTLKKVAQSLLPKVDSLGLNEQELGDLYISLNGKEYEKNDFKDPKIKTIVDCLEYIFQYFEDKNFPKRTRIFSRIHFHSLKFHIIVQKIDSKWDLNYAKLAVAKGALIAPQMACDNSHIQIQKIEYLLKNETNFEISPLNPLLDFQDSSKKLQFFLSPVLTCKKALKTVGLGDNVSGMGLIYHKWNK